MISGRVVGLQARLSVLVRIPGNAAIEIECVVDTGFEGFLTLPPAAIPVGIVSRIAKPRLPYLARINANLVNYRVS